VDQQATVLSSRHDLGDGVGHTDRTHARGRACACNCAYKKCYGIPTYSWIRYARTGVVGTRPED